MFCTYCGTSIRKKDKFCTVCGNGVHAQGDVEQAFNQSADFYSRPVYGIPSYAHQAIQVKRKGLAISLCLIAALLLVGAVLLIIFLLNG